MPKISRQFGAWDSPLSPAVLAEGKRLDGVQWDADSDTLVWLEGRSGKGVLVAQTGHDAPRDLTADLSVRAEVGYGGGDFTVDRGVVFFVVHKRGQLFRQPLAAGAARAIIPPFGAASSPAVSPDGRFVLYVHHDGKQTDCLAVVDSQGDGWPQILTSGNDFYMQPRWSSDGRYVCWIAWDHPNMPWDGTSLYLAPIESNAGLPRLGTPRRIAGGADTAIFQPEFTADGRYLLYISDETGWGRIATHDLASGATRWLTPDGVEYGAPAWVQDARTYAPLADSRTLVAASNVQGFQRLCRIDIETGQASPIDPLAEYSEITTVQAARHGTSFAIIASQPQLSPRVLACDLATGEVRVAARATGETIPPGQLAACEAISWRTASDETAHGLLYRPASERFAGTGAPPLITIVHGGPTSQVKAGWRAEAQFFATRGYAVLYVNYRGSTGYGRDYMLKLRGAWGICDVEDAVSGQAHLAKAGIVDAARTVIMGGSAGGFTVLQTMARRPEAFAAGISLYGVANQFSLAADTHKFESRYLDTMLGPLPEAAAVYRERSPVFHAASIRRPLAVFQGEIDTVVPKKQADEIVAALRRNGTPHVYHVYEGEGHGWRKRETIEHYYKAVDEFLRQHVLLA